MGLIKYNRSEVNLLRANVNHYSFVTGLIGSLEGKSGGPEDCSVGLNVILNADIHEGVRVSDPMWPVAYNEAPYHNVLHGNLGQCCDLLSWIGNTYDSKQLKENKFENGPSEFVIETWIAKKDDAYEWQLNKKTKWSGVKWLDAAHTGDGGDRMCAGVATFTCEEKIVENIDNGEIINISKTIKYPNFELRKILQQNMSGPKHPASYMG